MTLVSVDGGRSVRGGEGGNYTLQVPPGSYTLTVRALGHEQPPPAPVTVRAGEVAYRHFALKPILLGTPEVWRGCDLVALDPTSKCIVPQRITIRDLHVSVAGEWILRNAAEWAAFWEKYWRSPTIEPVARPSPPAVDWENSALIAVSYGQTSGCENVAWYINRVTLTPDSTVVSLGPDKLGSGFSMVTCMAVIEPVDVAIIPRLHFGQVVFRRVVPVPN